MKKRVWLSFDLGLGESHDRLFKWLADHEAKECGSNLATFEYEASSPDDLVDRLKEDLLSYLKIRNTRYSKIYIIYLDGNKMKGKFIMGKREPPRWFTFSSSYGSNKKDEDMGDGSE